MAFLFIYGPLLLTVAAWVMLYWLRKRQKLPHLIIIALSVVTANAMFAAGTYTYYQIHPPSDSLPPWKNPQTLNFGLLVLLAPIGMVVGGVAGIRGTAKWLVWLVELASIPLLVLGCAAGAAV